MHPILLQEEPELSKKGSQKSINNIVVNYAIHAHPMTHLKSPDLLDNQKNSLFQITCQILYAAMPLILCFELLVLPAAINAYVVGNHEGSDMMAAVGLGTVLSSIFGFLIIQNLSLGFSVVCSYFQDSQQIGFMYQKTLGINFFICIVITPLLYLSDKFLLSVGFNDHIIQYSTEYVWALVPSFYLFAFYETTTNYLQSQGIMYPPLIIGTVGTIVHYFLSSYFVVTLGLGITGAAWSLNVMSCLNSFALYFYIVKQEPTKESWIQWNIMATNNVHNFLVEILTHESFNYFQALAIRILCLIACYLPQSDQIAAHFALSTSEFIFHFIIVGVSNCLNRTISLSIEENDIRIAKKKIKLGIFFVLTFTIVVILNLLSQQEAFLKFFHDDPETVIAMRETFYVFLLVLMFDSIQIILFGILKTLQMEKLWKLPAICYYLVGMSFSLIFAFWWKWNLEGIWLGWLFGIIAALIYEIRYLWKLNWQQKFQQVRDKYKVIQENIRNSKMEMTSMKQI